MSPVSAPTLADARRRLHLLDQQLALLEAHDCAVAIPSRDRDEVFRNVLVEVCTLICRVTDARDEERTRYFGQGAA